MKNECRLLVCLVCIAFAGCSSSKEDATGSADPYKAFYLKECNNESMGGGLTTEICTCAYGKISKIYSFQQYREESERFKRNLGTSELTDLSKDSFLSNTAIPLRECMGQ